jgi:hypothetical protein
MATSVSPLPTKLTFATPLERRRIRIPRASSGLKPFDQLRRVGGRLTGQRTMAKIRWVDSVMFSQDPLSGVYSGMTPFSNKHTTNAV